MERENDKINTFSLLNILTLHLMCSRFSSHAETFSHLGRWNKMQNIFHREFIGLLFSVDCGPQKARPWMSPGSRRRLES